jgi:hypothetical protein
VKCYGTGQLRPLLSAVVEGSQSDLPAGAVLCSRTGRFLTRDPFPGLRTLPSTQHPYVYVGNNPASCY